MFGDNFCNQRVPTNSDLKSGVGVEKNMFKFSIIKNLKNASHVEVFLLKVALKGVINFTVEQIDYSFHFLVIALSLFQHFCGFVFVLLLLLLCYCCFRAFLLLFHFFFVLFDLLHNK